MINPGGSRKSLVKIAKAAGTKEVNSSLLDHLQSLERQGQMSRCTSPSCAPVWSRVVQTLPEEQMKFSLNAAVGVLPHNVNPHLWKKRNDAFCPLCHEKQSLLHILNNCSVARDARRYNQQHDLLLQLIAAAVRDNISTSTLIVDISDSNTFPLHIITTDLRLI